MPVFRPIISDIMLLLSDIMSNSKNFIFETGLLNLYYNRLEPAADLHDILDIFVINGFMSPCPSKSLVTGLAWYEINLVLYG